MEQWRRLARFGYPTNIRSFLSRRGNNSPEDTLVEFIAGSFRQAEAYFTATNSAMLDIDPLLLYYGATSLLAGAAALLIGSRHAVGRHGMQLRFGAGHRIAHTRIVPQNTADSGLHHYAGVFSSGCDLRGGLSWAWTLEEVLASIPDLKLDFESCYQGSEPYTVLVQVVRKPNSQVERVAASEIAKHPGGLIFARVVGCKTAYLPVQGSALPDYVSLHPRPGSEDIGTYSTLGQKHLQLAHVKNDKLLSPDQIILMLMGLFALGSLSRYSPEIWNPFVRRDDTGERLVIERFLDICRRYLPNLVLNRIEGSRLQFVHQIEQPLDERSALTKEVVEELVRRTMREKGI